MMAPASDGSVRYIWFDQDDTLYNYQDAMKRALRRCVTAIHERFPETAGTLGATELIRVRQEIVERADRAGMGLIEARCEAFRETLCRFARPDGLLADTLTTTYYETLRTGIRPFPGAVDCLRTLSDDGYILGIVSNGMSLLDELNLAHFFDHHVYALDLRLYKPDPAIFDHAMSLTGAAPEECLLIGDNRVCDVVGARRAGWTGVWLNRDGHSWEIEAEPPEHIVTCLTELPALLTQLNRRRVTHGEHCRR